jgi:hypothetical protein
MGADHPGFLQWRPVTIVVVHGLLVTDKTMHAARFVALLLALLATACTGIDRVPAPAEPAQPRAPEIASAPPSPAVATAQPTGASPTAAPSAALEAPTAVPAAPSTDQGASRSEAPASKAPVKSASPVTPSAKTSPTGEVSKGGQAESQTPIARKPESPPLDLASLETRLKESKAIGVMTKISLKNQVDELLDEFRAFYQGRLKTTLAELRKSFDLLVLKVLSLLQDGDPSLASAIVASREAIWGILSDPVKFANFTNS